MGKRDSRQAVRNGFLNRCPNCGEGHILRGYLVVQPQCEVCDEDFSPYPAADGPAFFTITIVMLLLIPMLGFGWTLSRAEPVTFFVVVSLMTTALTIALLRPIKSAFVAYLWAHDERDRGA